MVSQILMKTGTIKMMSFSLDEFKFLHKCEVIQSELILYWHVVLNRDKGEMEKGKLNSNVHQNPIKLIMNFTLFLLARFTKMWLLLKLMNGSCGME